MMKAVIIDDDITTIQGLTRSVRWSDFGIQVVGTAKNGKDGLEQIRLHRPDIILTDIFMPVMDGIEMLKAIREEGNHAEVIILSGYEDFKYAQSAVKLKVNDYLSKPATLEEIERVLKETVDKLNLKEQSDKVDKELRELLEYNLPTTRQQLLKGLLEPEFCHSAFFRKVSDYLKMDFTNQCFTVVLIEFFINRERTSYKPSELALFAYAVKNIVDELSQNKKGVYVADIQRNVITVIVSTPAHMKNEYAKRCAIQAAMEFLEHIQSYLKLKVWASVGMVADDVKDIPKSYSVAVDLLAERVRVSDKQLITGEDVLEKGKAASRRPMECYQAIADAVILGQEDLVEERINELTKALHHEPAPSINVLREFAIDIVGIIALGLHDHGLQIEDIHSEFNVYRELERLYSIQDFAAWLRELLIPISEVMNRRGSQKHRKTIDFIMRYVQEHYAEEITLDVIAEKVYLTRNYLSQIFKQETGENYNNYLTRIRMDKAKELMLSGNYKIFEISQMVGYKNNAYFSQLFKKHTGLNPSEFNN
ncbi:response regulator transcription factor [Paenibacillus silviterrae]|uniref:response regulator transcription factor n=1 Tax=Paenibacillus silviterrae TaxID=3242194 RepID=UPI002542706D|nr:response regulator [Paenibacillus chinjuensis]